jgi:hypothetical protein
MQYLLSQILISNIAVGGGAGKVFLSLFKKDVLSQEIKAIAS